MLHTNGGRIFWPDEASVVIGPKLNFVKPVSVGLWVQVQGLKDHSPYLLVITEVP